MDASVNQKVKDLVAQGKGREEIKKELAGKGISAESLDDVLDILMPTAPPPEPAAPVVPVTPAAPVTPAVAPADAAPPSLVTEHPEPPQRKTPFFRQLLRTPYSPPAYAEIITRSIGASIKFFLKFALLLLLISMIIAIGPLIKADHAIKQQLPASVETIINEVPADVHVHIVNGQVTTNAKQPLFIKNPYAGTSQFKNIIVVDTKTPFSADKFQQYNTVAWLTKDSVIAYSHASAQSGEQVQASNIQVIPLTNVQNMDITRGFLQDQVTKYKPWLNYVLPVLVVGGIIALYLFHVGKLIYLLAAALVVLVGAKLAKVPLTYSQSYRVALFASVPVFVLQTILRDGVQAPWPTFTTTLLILIIALVNLVKAKPLFGQTAPANPES